MKIGYMRVSSSSQKLDRQEVIMEKLSVDRIYVDVQSGKDTSRPELQRMLSEIQNGDTLIVESISRFARNTKDLLNLIEKLDEK
ncbi:MAG: recombinase family protein, partial [Acetoanaerobium sp.]|nr:recombinase family protein [Acetoanaerobium sp.]